MRRALAAMTVAAMMIAATAVLAATGVESYRDEFGAISYSGSDGTLDWGNPWKEIGENKNDDPSSGAVQVVSHDFCVGDNCLRIGGEGLLLLSETGAMRFADLGDFEDADLCYQVRRNFDDPLDTSLLDDPLLEETSDKLLVQVTSDGTDWNTIRSYRLNTTDAEADSRCDGVKNWISAGFGLRFVVTKGLLDGEVYIDNVEVKGTVTSSTTTTTTTTQATTTTTSDSQSNGTTSPTSEEAETATSTEEEATTEQAEDTGTTATGDTDDGLTAAIDPAQPPTGPSFGDGIRVTDNGVQADFRPGLFGSMDRDGPQVLGAALAFDYRMAVEAIEAAWLQVLVLAALIAGALVVGLDRRSTRSQVTGE